MKNSSFRMWLQEMWYKHLDELESYGERNPQYNSSTYFSMYKYWLKREYRHHQEAQCFGL
jgi:hypothetical protein